MTYENTPVLHLAKDRIVFIPLTHPTVIEQGHVFHIEHHDLMAIGSTGYLELEEQLCLPDIIESDTRDYIVGRMMARDFEGAKKLTTTGFQCMYNCYSEASWLVEELLRIMPEELPNWIEATVEELLLKFNIDGAGMDENAQYMAVLAHIEAEEDLTLEATYDDGGKDWILYRIGKLNAPIEL